MGGENDLELTRLMQRFDAGDRSADLMTQLNQAAFNCFHAPWESLPGTDQLEIPAQLRLSQGRLPLEGDDSDETESEADLQDPSPSGNRKAHQQPSKSRNQVPSEFLEKSGGPLDALDKALEALGRRGHLLQGHSLTLDLPFDARSDNQSRLAFRAHGETACFQVISSGDLSLTGMSELELERICRTYNRRATGMEAKTLRHIDGARPRLRLVTIISFELTQSLPALMEHLNDVFRKEKLFWRFIQQNRPK